MCFPQIQGSVNNAYMTDFPVYKFPLWDEDRTNLHILIIKAMISLSSNGLVTGFSFSLT